MKEIRKRKTYPLRLSRFELLHLRDLFSVLLSTDAKQTVSQALASAENRGVVESRLWQRLTVACHEAELPMDDDAPDFICAVSSMEQPPVGVFRVAHDPDEAETAEKSHSGHPFGSNEEESE